MKNSNRKDDSQLSQKKPTEKTGNFKENPDRASEAGRKGGQNSQSNKNQ